MLEEINAQQLVSEPTCTTGNILDVVIASETLNLVDPPLVLVNSIGSSDHYPIQIGRAHV